MKAMIIKRTDGPETAYIEDYGTFQVARDGLSEDEIEQLTVWGNKPAGRATIEGWELTPEWEIIWQS